jgi:hypothetical protein
MSKSLPYNHSFSVQIKFKIESRKSNRKIALNGGVGSERSREIHHRTGQKTCQRGARLAGIWQSEAIKDRGK